MASPRIVKCSVADCHCCTQHQGAHPETDDCRETRCSARDVIAGCAPVSVEEFEAYVEAHPETTEEGAFTMFLLRRKQEIVADKLVGGREYNMGDELKLAWDAGREYERRYPDAV